MYALVTPRTQRSALRSCTLQCTETTRAQDSITEATQKGAALIFGWVFFCGLCVFLSVPPIWLRKTLSKWQMTFVLMQQKSVPIEKQPSRMRWMEAASFPNGEIL